MVRAKFWVTGNNQGENAVAEVTLSAVTSGSPENQEFFTSTPTGQISLSTVNPIAAAQFETGKEFYVDFKDPNEKTESENSVRVVFEDADEKAAFLAEIGSKTDEVQAEDLKNEVLAAIEEGIKEGLKERKKKAAKEKAVTKANLKADLQAKLKTANGALRVYLGRILKDLDELVVPRGE